MVQENKIIQEIKGWHKIREIVIGGDVMMWEYIAHNFSPKMIDIIRDDLYWTWLGTRPANIKEFDLYIKEMYSQNTTERVSRYAKPSDFSVPKKVRHLSFSRVDANQVGSKYADKWGKVNVWKFQDDEGEKQLQSTSYSFSKDFNSSGVKSGEECIVFMVGFSDPLAPEQTYKRWIFQKVFKVATIQVEETTQEDAGNTTDDSWA